MQGTFPASLVRERVPIFTSRLLPALGMQKSRTGPAFALNLAGLCRSCSSMMKTWYGSVLRR